MRQQFNRTSIHDDHKGIHITTFSPRLQTQQIPLTLSNPVPPIINLPHRLRSPHHLIRINRIARSARTARKPIVIQPHRRQLLRPTHRRKVRIRLVQDVAIVGTGARRARYSRDAVHDAAVLRLELAGLLRGLEGGELFLL